MPEGDTLYRAARRLERGLRGDEVVAVAGSHRAAAAYGRRLVGRTVDEVENRGKHLLIHFSGGWSARTHLRMTGTWDVYTPGQRWRKEPGAARLVLTTADAVAVCFAAPDVDIKPTHIIEDQVAHLGPDLTADGFDTEEALRRIAAADSGSLAGLLLDQSVMAGIGNVFKSEIAFSISRDPAASIATLSGEERRQIVDDARRMLYANRDTPNRVTTGDPRRPLFVYGRNRRGCLRCRTPIRSGEVGDPVRVTYWCPRCQSG